MTAILFKGEPVQIKGNFPKIGDMASAFTLTDKQLKDRTLSEFAGKTCILNIFPSLDTPTCAQSVRAFNRAAADLKDTVVLCVSMDLPFAQNRFCVAEGIENVLPLSAFRSPAFGETYGITIASGPLQQLLSRAVIIINPQGKIIYTEHVAEITEEPDYATALAAARLGHA